jgi:putative hydrolase of the HAD superfamily
MKTYRTLFLDLDDTLYPNTSGLWQAIGDRIHAYMIEQVGISPDHAEQLRRSYYQTHGTTLNGLRIEHQIDPYDYLDYVHRVPIEKFIDPNPQLQKMLQRIPQKRVVFTNAHQDHAQRVLHRLGVFELIDQIVDITALDFINKPKPTAYRKALSLSGEMEPEACVLVDDRAVNLVPGKAIGMTTVLIGESQTHASIDYCLQSITELVEAVPGLAS